MGVMFLMYTTTTSLLTLYIRNTLRRRTVAEPKGAPTKGPRLGYYGEDAAEDIIRAGVLRVPGPAFH